MEQYEVVFYDEDRVTVLDKQVVNKGEKVTYKGVTPEKPEVVGVKYVFVGWELEEKLESIQENLSVFAKFEEEGKVENALYNATLDSSKNATINATMDAARKLSDQMKLVEKSDRDPEDIVNEVLTNGKAELDRTQDNLER